MFNDAHEGCVSDKFHVYRLNHFLHKFSDNIYQDFGLSGSEFFGHVFTSDRRY